MRHSSAFLRTLLACCAASLAILAGLTAGGCGSETPSASCEQIAASRVQQERLQKIAGVFDLLEQVGMADWAAYGRGFLNGGRILGADFSSPDRNPFRRSGLDAAADITNGRIYIDLKTWDWMLPRDLADVMLDELCHLKYRTSDHTYYYEASARYTQLWEAAFGKSFRQVYPEDVPYLDYLRAWHPRWPISGSGVRVESLAAGVDPFAPGAGAAAP